MFSFLTDFKAINFLKFFSFWSEFNFLQLPFQKDTNKYVNCSNKNAETKLAYTADGVWNGILL